MKGRCQRFSLFLQLDWDTPFQDILLNSLSFTTTRKGHIINIGTAPLRAQTSHI